jgi:Mlc titration factor MtfA (ptsG expression regulator)
MFFSWLRDRRRRAIVSEPFPTEWLSHLDTNVAHFALLSTDDQAKLRDLLRVFIAERDWEGCGGLVLTDEMRVTIAAHACILILALDIDCYADVSTILVYPQAFMVPSRKVEGVIVTESEKPTLGEAHLRGPVVLAWDEVLQAGRDLGIGENLVFHEFAHQLDFSDGVIDGTPPLSGRGEYDAWREGMGHALDEVRREVKAHRRSLLGSYAAQNPAEFFAVATECFFDNPKALEMHHPTVYGLLKNYYRQDPAQRVPDRHTPRT